MDGSERIVYEEGTPEAQAFSSQPQVIVERVVPDDLIVEEEMVADEGIATEEATQNGDASSAPAAGAAPLAATLNDIIADAVATEEDADQAATTAAAGDAVDNAGEAGEEGDEEGEEEEEEEGEPEEEVATPSRKKEEPSLELNQCRTCTSREDLQDIFEPLKRDESVPISQLITKLCANVTITKRDHLPNVICKGCVYKLEIAWEFRHLCEKTDQELRKSLPRAKNKVRKRTDYTLIDYESSSGDDAGGNVDDEDEFKLSDELADETEPSDSDVDFSDSAATKRNAPKKRGRPKKTPVKVPVKPVTGTTPSPRGRGRPPKSATKTTPLSAAAKTKSPRAPIVYVEAKEEDDEDSDSEEEDSDEATPPPKKKKPVAAAATPSPAKQCPKCKVVLTKGPHVCKPVSFSCSFCAEKFATHPLYMNHQQLHTNFQNANTCVRCHKKFPDKPQLRKHQSGIRCHKATKNNCLNCGRVLANASQLAIHLRTKCVPPSKVGGGGTPVQVKKEGALKVASPKKEKNPFKYVAPPTTTHWSDSFSE